MPGKRVLVLGGGFGGVRAAITARLLLDSSHEVTLIDRQRRTYICGSMPLLIVGEKEAAKASRSLGQLANRGVRYVETEIRSIDLPGRSVATDAGVQPFDYLIVALGAEYDWDAVPNSRQGYSFYNLATARRLRDVLRRFRKGRVVVAISSLPYKCPPAPFEAAMIMRWAFQRAGVSADVEIDLYTPEPAPIPVAGPEASSCVAADLKARSVQLHPNSAVKELSVDGRSASFTDGSSATADLIITIPTHRVARVVAESGLAGGKPWVGVDQATMAVSGHPGVYAIGDATAVMMANGRPMPKAGIFASREGDVAARNVAAEIAGSETARFSGEGYCFITYSGREAGQVTGRFLASEKPDVVFQQPSRRGFRAKEKFELDWRRFRL
jgi:sulfide:quinone oxidoreductase